LTSWKELKDWRENFRLRERQEKILARLNIKFPITNYEEMKDQIMMATLCELTETTIHDYNLSTRVIGISTNDEYFEMLKEDYSSVASWALGKPIYYEFDNIEFPDNWFMRSIYWRIPILEQVVKSFRAEYKVFIPNKCYPIVLMSEGVYVIVAPIGIDQGQNYKLSSAIPNAKDKLDAYDKVIQDEIKAGFKWKIEFEKNDRRGVRQLFGFYTDKKKAYAMAGVISEGGNYVHISKVEVKKDLQYIEARLLG